jgi:flagellar motor switch protein FliG
LLREVATDRLTVALKGAAEEVRAAIFAGLSARAAELISDDLEVLGKVRKNEIDTARSEVLQVALRLEAEGKIDLGRETE